MTHLHIVHRKLLIIGIIFILSWLVGTFLIHKFEYGHPIGESYFNAFYFTVITTATIWFWDLVPITICNILCPSLSLCNDDSLPIKAPETQDTRWASRTKDASCWSGYQKYYWIKNSKKEKYNKKVEKFFAF